MARGDLVKGYEIAKGEYILFDKDELDSVKLESTHIIDIQKFVPASSIDRRYWSEKSPLVGSRPNLADGAVALAPSTTTAG